MHKEPLSALSYSWGALQISVRFHGVTEQKPAQHAHLLKLSLSFCFDRLALCLHFSLHSDASLATATVSSEQQEAPLHPAPAPRSLTGAAFVLLVPVWSLQPCLTALCIPPPGPPPHVTPWNSTLLFYFKSRPGIWAKTKSDQSSHWCRRVFLLSLSLGFVSWTVKNENSSSVWICREHAELGSVTQGVYFPIKVKKNALKRINW